jgi:hypothetical protein
VAARLGVRGAGERRGVVDVGQDGAGAFQVALADLGECG